MNRKPGKRPVLSAMLLIIGLMLASAAAAGEGKSDDFDANGDGQITFSEVMQRLESSARITFDALDRNRDGVLSSKDLDDVREGMKKLEEWLDDLLEPFLKEGEGPIEV